MPRERLSTKREDFSLCRLISYATLCRVGRTTILNKTDKRTKQNAKPKKWESNSPPLKLLVDATAFISHRAFNEINFFRISFIVRRSLAEKQGTASGFRKQISDEEVLKS